MSFNRLYFSVLLLLSWYACVQAQDHSFQPVITTGVISPLGGLKQRVSLKGWFEDAVVIIRQKMPRPTCSFGASAVTHGYRRDFYRRRAGVLSRGGFESFELASSRVWSF